MRKVEYLDAAQQEKAKGRTLLVVGDSPLYWFVVIQHEKASPGSAIHAVPKSKVRVVSLLEKKEEPTDATDFL